MRGNRSKLSGNALQKSLVGLKPAVTMFDSLSDLPPLGRSFSDHVKLQHQFHDGCKLYPGHTGSYIHLPSKTLKAGVHGVPGGENNIVFSDGSFRYLSVREGARLQAFPDEYNFSGAWSVCFRQIGNGVPVRLAELMGASIKDALSGYSIEASVPTLGSEKDANLSAA